VSSEALRIIPFADLVSLPPSDRPVYLAGSEEDIERLRSKGICRRDIYPVPRRLTELDRVPGDLATQIEESPTGCWLWTGHRTDEGYGRARWLGRDYAAHRLVWRVLRGELKRTQDLHHTCNTAACVRPAHLQPMSPKEHTALHSQQRRKPALRAA
jgi:hypothetical protein